MPTWEDFHGFTRGEPEPVLGEVRFNQYGHEVIKEWWDGGDWKFACSEEDCFKLGDFFQSKDLIHFCEQHLLEAMKNGDHVLYRHFGGCDELLYIGITNDISKRWRAHKSTSSWRRKVYKTTYEYFHSREALLQAERLAIQAERPRFNIIHSTVAGLH